MHPTTPATTASDHSPLGLLLNAYDQAITACRTRNTARAYRTILTLREAHPCDSPSAAGIDGLYAYCERAILSGDFLGAARTLEQLRGAWETADRITSVPSSATSRINAFTPARSPSQSQSMADQRAPHGPDASPDR